MRGLSPPSSIIRGEQPSPSPLSLAKGEAPLVRAIPQLIITNSTSETSSTRRAHLLSKGKIKYE